jgi:hypothetical protein
VVAVFGSGKSASSQVPSEYLPLAARRCRLLEPCTPERRKRSHVTVELARLNRVALDDRGTRELIALIDRRHLDIDGSEQRCTRCRMAVGV